AQTRNDYLNSEGQLNGPWAVVQLADKRLVVSDTNTVRLQWMEPEVVRPVVKLSAPRNTLESGTSVNVIGEANPGLPGYSYALNYGIQDQGLAQGPQGTANLGPGSVLGQVPVPAQDGVYKLVLTASKAGGATFTDTTYFSKGPFRYDGLVNEPWTFGAMAVDPASGHLFVAGVNQVLEYDAQKNLVSTTTIPDLGSSTACTISGGLLYVRCSVYGTDFSNTLRSYKLPSSPGQPLGALVASTPMPYSGQEMEVFEGKLYVADANYNLVRVYDAATLAPLTKLGTDGHLGGGVKALWIMAKTREMWIGQSNGWQVYALDSGMYRRWIPATQANLYRMWADEDAGLVYATFGNGSQLQVYDLASGQFVAQTRNDYLNSEGQLNGPWAVVQLADKRLVVSDMNTVRLQWMEPEMGAASLTTPTPTPVAGPCGTCGAQYCENWDANSTGLPPDDWALFDQGQGAAAWVSSSSSQPGQSLYLACFGQPAILQKLDVDVSQADFSAQVVSADQAQLVVDGQGSDGAWTGGYYLQAGGGQISMGVVNSAVPLASTSLNFGPPYVLELQAQNGALIGLVNGVPMLGPVVDNTYSHGAIGLQVYGANTVELDNFKLNPLPQCQP
ncbi:MAG TPA: hypothetical protein VNZ67_00455, partial [bacterium]|nr:hypothetical protein [bacterium]